MHPPDLTHLRTHRLLAVLMMGGLAMLAGGCGKTARTLTPPALPPPPQVLATEPVARSTLVLYDTPIWVDFATDMDAGSLTATHVFLKLDTQRVPVTLQWSSGTRRLTLVPQVPLQLRRTYTVELTSGVRTAAGASLGPAGWFFQFTTNGARRPDHARPFDGTADESPFSMLSWDSTETSAGPMSYEVWSGTDSAQVAERSGLPRTTLTKAYWLPTAAWPLGQRIHWAITVVNGTTGERLNGPVHTFDVLPAGTPVDSLLLLADDFGYNAINVAQSAVNPLQTCGTDSVISSSGIQCWMTFPVGLLPADLRVASARLEVHTFDYWISRVPFAVPVLWSARREWLHPCRPSLQLPQNLPVRDQLVASGRLESGRRILYMSDLLASHVEASIRRGGFFGYELSTGLRISYATPHYFDGSRHPYLKVHYYRTSPAPLSAVAP